MKLRKAIRVSCLVYKTLSDRVIEALGRIGIASVHVQSGRIVVLKETSGFFGIGAGEKLEEDPSELFSFTVSPGSEKKAMAALFEACESSVSGRGSIVAEQIETSGEARQARGSEGLALQSGLCGVTCIVQRGFGNAIARAALDMGFSVPLVSFGIGTGLRDKLGLLRVTIPAEKEVVQLFVTEHDADAVMSFLVDAGKIGQPGKGFIYTYPIARGALNTKLHRGKQKHAASVEQMISAIDDLKRSTEWRKRSLGARGRLKTRKYLADLVNVIVVCNEGRASDLVRAAMGVGATGATVSKLHYIELGRESNATSPARESIDFAISRSQAGPVVSAIEAAGAFDAKTAGIIELKQINHAYTYLGGNA